MPTPMWAGICTDPFFEHAGFAPDRELKTYRGVLLSLSTKLKSRASAILLIRREAYAQMSTGNPVNFLCEQRNVAANTPICFNSYLDF